MPEPWPRTESVTVLDLDSCPGPDGTLPNSNYSWQIDQQRPAKRVRDNPVEGSATTFPFAAFAIKRNGVCLPVAKWAVYIAMSSWAATGVAPEATYLLNYFFACGNAPGEFVGNSVDQVGLTTIPISTDPIEGTGLLGQLRGQLGTHLFVFLSVATPPPFIPAGRVKLLLRVMAQGLGGSETKPTLDKGVWG